MKRISLLLSIAALFALTSTASAQEGGERPTALGVGINGFLIDGLATGPSVVFQTPAFHIEGILAALDDGGDDLDVGIGGRFWFAVSQTSRSDFSIGGGLALLIDEDEATGDDETDVEIDLGAQLRAFIVPNVAISATAGFAVVVTDGDDFVGLVGDLLGQLGVVYFF